MYLYVLNSDLHLKIFFRRILNAVWCGLIALVFSMYLVYDTQRILGGKKHSLSGLASDQISFQFAFSKKEH